MQLADTIRDTGVFSCQERRKCTGRFDTYPRSSIFQAANGNNVHPTLTAVRVTHGSCQNHQEGQGFHLIGITFLCALLKGSTMLFRWLAKNFSDDWREFNPTVGEKSGAAVKRGSRKPTPPGGYVLYHRAALFIPFFSACPAPG